ncbi:MAG: tetratricopeptide repeat protein [Rhodanobacter sp.]
MNARAFIDELKRRNVLRSGAVYVVALWAFGQGLSQFSPALGLPDWTTRWFLVATCIGFPLWLAFAWFYEFTPTGLRRESDIEPAESVTAHTGRMQDFWIIGILAVAVVALATNQFVLRRDVPSTASATDAKNIAATVATLPEKSVAVLPLSNESGDPKQQYFSDGLSEELISDLTQINGLKVIGKYSSFKFRDSSDSPARIGAALGVAHLIQGSVRQQGDRIRVTVGMIRAADGSSVWSRTYDDQLKDVFAIQTKIGQAVASSLKVQLLGQTLGIDDKPPSGNVEAYRLMLQGRALGRQVTEGSVRQGMALYQQALELDPSYAYAWGTLSNAWVNLEGHLSGAAQQQAHAHARVAADHQQVLAPDAAATHMTRGYLLSYVENDPAGALTEYRRAYALAPNDGTVMSFLATGLSSVGQLQPAVELYRKAIATDPLRVSFYFSLARVLLAQGQLDGAEQATGRALVLQPDYPGLHLYLAAVYVARGQLDAAEQATRQELALKPNAFYVYGNLAQIDIVRGDAAAALRNAKKERDPEWKAWAVAASMQIASDQKKAGKTLQGFIAAYGKDNPYDVAALHALRKQPDKMFEWLQKAWKQHDPQLIQALLTDPFVLPYQHDQRFVAMCRQTGLPLPGQVLPAAALSDRP